jgi:hypothetical protein
MLNGIHHYLALTAALSSVGFHSLSRPVFPDQHRITIKPQLLTMREIASRLTTPDRKVECAKGIAGRVAFVFLKNRPDAEAVQVLSEALDVALKPKEGDPGTWVLDSDPDVFFREKKWRHAYAACFRRSLAVQQTPMQPYLDLSYPELKKRFLDTNSRYDYGVRTGWVKQDLKREQLYRSLQAFGDEYIGARWLTDRWLREGVLPPEWLEQALFGSPAIKNAGIGLVTKYLPLKAFSWYSDPPRASAVIYGFDASQTPYSVRIVFALCLPDGGVKEFMGFFIFRPNSIFEVFVGNQIWTGLGPDAVKWLEQQYTTTAQFLSTDTAKKVVELKVTPEITSLSQVMELWAAATGSECVMELTPQREGLARHDATLAGLAQNFKRPSSVKVSLAYLFTDFMPTDPRDNIAQAWTVVDKSGVIILKNRWSFIDRISPFPLVALRDLERKSAAQTAGKPSGMEFNYEDALAYCRATTPLQNRQWSSIASNGWYRGLYVDSLTSHAAVTLWEGLPASARRLIFSRMGVHHFPMSIVSDKTVNQMVTALRAGSFRSLERWRPYYAQGLGIADIKVTVAPERNEKRVSLVFEIDGGGMTPVPPVREKLFLMNVLKPAANVAQPETHR